MHLFLIPGLRPSNRQNKVKYEGIERSEIPEWSYEDWNEELVEL